MFFFINFSYAEDIGVIFVNEEGKKKDAYIQTETFIENMPMQKQITTKEALDMPGVQGDPIKAIKTFAGVLSTSDMSGEMLIHGSKARENSASLNHLPLPDLFHFGGLHSIVAPEATEQIDVYLGGFDATYGQTMGGVFDITPKYPEGTNKGFVHMGIYDSSLGLDFKINNRTNGFIGGRRSYFDLLVDKTGKLGDSEDEITYTKFPRFYDGTLMLTLDSSDSFFSFESITARDSLIINTQEDKVKDPAATGTINHTSGFTTTGLRWKYKPSGDFTAHTLIYHSKYYYDSQIFDEYKAKITENVSGLYHISTWDTDKNKISLGGEYIYEDIPLDLYIPKLPEREDPDFDLTTAEKYSINKHFTVNNYATFIQNIQTITNKTKIRYGLRVFDNDYESYDTRVNPRVGLIYSFNKDISTSFSVGEYSQFADPLKNIEQVGNKDLVYEDSRHYTLNYSQTFTNKHKISIEPYFKKFENLAVSVDDDRNYLNTGEGEAYGLDVTYTKPLLDTKWNLIFSYSYIDAKRTIKDGEGMKKFYGEMPHTIQVMGSYLLKNDWKFSSLIKYHSGAYYTPVIGRYQYTDSDGTTRWRPTYGSYLSGQLPDYFTLNLKISKTKYLSYDRSLEFSFEIMNITNHSNIDGIRYNDDYTEKEYESSMPLLPWFDVTYRF